MRRGEGEGATARWRAGLRGHRWEWLFVAVLVAALAWAGYQFGRIGYLPLPFFPDPNDVYADGYSTAWWAFNGAMYDVWRTVYPPLSFALIKLVATPACYDRDVFVSRECDWSFWSWTLAFYVLNGVIAARAYWLTDRGTAAPRVPALMLGLPMLYAFEHLNLLVFAYTGMFVAFSPVFRSSWVRWLGIAVAINLKIYFVALLLGQLLKRRWRWVEGGLAVTLVVAIVSWTVVGEGSPIELYRNITIFSSDSERSSSWQFVIYAASYTSMIKFMASNFPLMPILGSWRLEFWATALTLLILAVQAVSLLAMAAVWLRPGAVTRARVAALCYLFVLVSTEPGGYAMAGAVFLIFFERWEGPARITALVTAYLLCLAIDINLVPIGTRAVNGYLAGRTVWQDMWLSAGPFVRPGLVMVAQLALAAATFGDVRRHIRLSEPAPALRALSA